MNPGENERMASSPDDPQRFCASRQKSMLHSLLSLYTFEPSYSVAPSAITMLPDVAANPARSPSVAPLFPPTAPPGWSGSCTDEAVTTSRFAPPLQEERCGCKSVASKMPNVVHTNGLLKALCCTLGHLSLCGWCNCGVQAEDVQYWCSTLDIVCKSPDGGEIGEVTYHWHPTSSACACRLGSLHVPACMNDSMPL